MGAHRHEDDSCCDALAGAHEPNGMRVFDHRALGDDRHAGLGEIGVVDRLEPGHLGVATGLQDAPVEARRGYAPAEAGGIRELVGEAPGIDHQLLGDAAPDHAGAADPVFLGELYPGAMTGRDAGRAYAAGTAADDEQVDVEGLGRVVGHDDILRVIVVTKACIIRRRGLHHPARGTATSYAPAADRPGSGDQQKSRPPFR
jgi:hypothetical protein